MSIVNGFRLVPVLWLMGLFFSLFGTCPPVSAAALDWSISLGANLQTARMGHLSEVLPDGRVVVFGGHGTEFVALDSAEVWTPVSDSFSLLAMQHFHDAAALAKLLDGRYLLAGGADDWGVAPGFDAAELYNPDNNTFTLTGSMTRPRMNATASTLTSGKVLIVGGWYDSSSATYGELYNQATGTFTATGSLIIPRALPLVLPTNDGKAVVFGGVAPFGSPRIEEVELFNPATNSFSLLQTTLFEGQSGWHIAASNYTQPQKLTDGRYVLLASRESGNVSEYSLFTFNPIDKGFTQQVLPSELPTSDVMVLWPPLVDEVSRVSYLVGTSLDESDQTLVSLLVIDLTDWTVDAPEYSYRLPEGYYLGGMSASLLPDGRLFLTGGHSQTGYDTNFSPVKWTLLGDIELVGVEPCTYSISPAQKSFAATGGTGSVSLTVSSASCDWTATSSDGWLTVTAGSSGTGSGTVSYAVQANPLGGSRSATLTIAGQVFTVFQAGPSSGETLTGTSGDDIMTVPVGNATIDGLAGEDTVRLPFFPNVYTFTKTGNTQYTAQYQDKMIVLNNVEYVEFGSFFKTRLPIADMLSGEVQTKLARLTDLYLAFFGRAPDVSGLEYWQEQLFVKGKDFVAISKDFAWSTEAQALYPQDGSNRDFVQTVYQNCFGRNPDPGGWDYWTGRLNALGVTDLSDRGEFVGNLLLGAYAPTSGDEDRDLLTNRHEVALSYVNKLSIQPEEGFDTAINDLLNLVDMNADTTESAAKVLDYVFAEAPTLTQVMSNQELLTLLWTLVTYIDWEADADKAQAKVILPANSPLKMAEVAVSVVFNDFKPNQNGELELSLPKDQLTDAHVMLPYGADGEYVVYLFATVLPGETGVEFSVAATAVNLLLNGIDREYLLGALSPAEVRSIIRSNSASFITSFSAALTADPYYLRSENLANVYNAAFYAALSASQAALQQAQQAQGASQTLPRAVASETNSEGLTVEPAKEIQDYKILPARGGLVGYGNMTGDLLIQNDSMLPARYKLESLFTGLTTYTPPTGIFGGIISPQSSLIYGYNAGSATTANNHFESVALTLYTAGWKLYFNDDAAMQTYVRDMNRALNQRLLLDNVINILSNLVPVSDESFYKAWLQWLGDQGFFQTAMDKFYIEKDIKGAVEGFMTGMLNWDNLRDTLKFVAKYYAKKTSTDAEAAKFLLKEKAKWLFKLTTIKAKVWIYAADLISTEADLISTDPVLEFTKVTFPLYLENYGPSSLSKVRNVDDNRKVTLFGDGLNAFVAGGTNYEPTIVLEAMNTVDEKRTLFVAGTDIHSGGSDSIWFDLPYDWANTGSDIKGPIYFQLRHAFVDPYTGNVVSNVSFPHELSDNAFYKIDLTSDLLITGVSKDKVTRGEDLTIFGSGFAPLMSQNHVLIRDYEGLVLPAAVTFGTDSYLEVTVPEGLDHGPLWIQVVLDDGTESNEYKFPLIPKPVEVSPADRTDFETQLVVTLTQSEGIDIFYTIDNGAEQSYSGPITINKTSTIYPYARKTVEGVDYTSLSAGFFYYKCAENEVLEDGECVDPNATEPVTFNFIQPWEKEHRALGQREAAIINFTANVNGLVENAQNPSVTLKNFTVDNAKKVEIANMKFTEDVIVSGSINVSLSAFTITATGYDGEGNVNEVRVYTYSNPQLVRYNDDVWIETYPGMNFRVEAFSDDYYDDTDLYVEYTVAVDGWYRSSDDTVTYIDETYQNQKLFHLKIDVIKDVPSWGTP